MGWLWRPRRNIGSFTDEWSDLCLARAQGVIFRWGNKTVGAMHTHTVRRAKSEAAREADFDEHRWDPRAFGCAGHDERTP